MQINKFVDYTRLDQKTFEIAGAIEANLLKFINPQNLTEEKNNFFKMISMGEKYNPKFNYLPRTNFTPYFSTNSKLNTYKNELSEMMNEIRHDELGLVFESEIIDQLEKIELIKSIGTENFSANSESYYGGLERKAIQHAKKIIQQEATENETPIPFEEAISEIKQALKKENLHYKIVLREPAGSKFAVINSRRELLINKDAVFTKQTVGRFIAHEIQTHIYRYENGLCQPYKLLAHGFSRETTETEEGLAVCVEKMLGVSSEKQIKEYAGRLVAISEAQKKNFFETFNEMKKNFDEEKAFRLTLRAKRGIKSQENEGAFFKDALYFNGMLKVEEFLKEHSPKELYYGKYSIYDLPLVRDIPGLKEPKHYPNFN